ncbi:MAG: outer membrane beta-barrel protein [Candidatus Thiothrix putei]|uniref:Outer membrane beta-barrel protein n=1 Tax=Candidatus Thiothrix putei TaxID=3080811 RepID=A0AA95KIK9_9GAMM|nr:MAG: outer membrane beta-barrel protein [Candidatus Thiothrix putei]
MKTLRALNTALVIMFSCGTVNAGGYSFYVGAAPGKTFNNGSGNQLCETCADYPLEVTDNDTGYKVYAGLNLTDKLAIEGEYADLGKTYAVSGTNNTGSTGTIAMTDNLDVVSLAYFPSSRFNNAFQETTGVGVSLKASTPVNAGSTKLFGKAGVFAWKNANYIDYTRTGSGSEVHETEDNGVSPVVGVGAEHAISNHWRVRGGWDHYFKVGQGEPFLHTDSSGNYADLQSVDTDVDMAYLGMTYDF